MDGQMPSMVSGLMPEGEDVVMRGQVDRSRLANRAEAEEILAVDAGKTPRAQEWYATAAEEVSDYVVFGEAPAGSISFCTAEWLTGCLVEDGRLRAPAGLEIVLRAMEKSSWSPPALSAFALSQVAAAVSRGDGRTIGLERSIPGVIGKPETDLVRRILLAFSGDRAVAVTRDEADILLRINDATVEEMNHPSWNVLFVKAIANCVFAASGYAVPARSQALAREQVLDRDDTPKAECFERMIAGGLAHLVDLYRADEGGSAGEDQDPVADAVWIAEQLSRDRLLHENERALFALIARGGNRVHGAFSALLARVT